MIIGVAFDGTIVENVSPDDGTPLPGAIETLRDLVDRRPPERYCAIQASCCERLFATFGIYSSAWPRQARN